MKITPLAKQLGFGAALALSASLLVPATVSAQEELPDLEGTTYGIMLSDLQMQLDKLERALTANTTRCCTKRRWSWRNRIRS